MPTTDALRERRAEEAPARYAGGASEVQGLRLALAGGGTGGHIVPGLHLLAWMRENEKPVGDALWFVSGRSVEERVLANVSQILEGTPFARAILPIEPPGGGAPSRSRIVLHAPRAVMVARRHLVAHRSDVLVGLGGFTSLPAVLAARSLKIPVVLIEINAHAGAATHWLSSLSARVLHAWKATLPVGESGRHRLVGPPLDPVFHRRACLSSIERERDALRARAALGYSPDLPLLVVLGGSQGSTALNNFVRAHATAIVGAGVQILHQTGPKKLGEAAAQFTGYRAVEYVDAMHEVLAAATFCLCRGGASTLAEVAAMRVPAFVAPYPSHKDRHQEKNAAELGLGVRLVQDTELDTSARNELVRLCATAARDERALMSAALASAVPTDAAQRIWTELAALSARNHP